MGIKNEKDELILMLWIFDNKKKGSRKEGGTGEEKYSISII